MTTSKQDILDDLGNQIEFLNTQRITAGYSKEQKKEFKKLADEGQQRFFKLMVQNFNATAKDYEDAGKKMQAVIASSTEDLQKLENMVKFVANLRSLFASIDKIIAAGAKIVKPL